MSDETSDAPEVLHVTDRDTFVSRDGPMAEKIEGIVPHDCEACGYDRGTASFREARGTNTYRLDSIRCNACGSTEPVFLTYEYEEGL